MDILTLELLDVTVFQALLELRALLAEHPGDALRIRGEDEMLRLNVEGFLAKQGRITRVVQQGRPWELLLAAAPAPAAPVPGRPQPRPALLLRSAFSPGDRALGRRLLLETLAHLEAGTPWVCLAHQAVELLEDPLAVEALNALQARGIPVRLSPASVQHHGLAPQGFGLMADADWQKALAAGTLTPI